MTIRSRLLSTLLVATATTGAVVVPAADAKVKPATAAKILQDCKSDSTINKPYRLADLKKAKTAYNKKKRKYPECGAAINSAIAGLSGKKGKASTTAVIRECSNGGALKKRYTASTLRKALKALGSDGENYTNCRPIIESQLNTITKR